MSKLTVSEPIPADRLLSENPEATVVGVEHDGGNADEHPRPLREVAALVTLPEMLWVVRIGTPPFAPDFQDYIATERRPLRGQTLFRVVDWGPDSWMARRIKVVWSGTREPVIHHLS